MQPYCRQDRTQARRALVLIRRAVQRTDAALLPVTRSLIAVVEARFELPPRLPDRRKKH